ncbi:unnamed protein product, partial [Ectocarpus sp. 12 AP-2014]
MRGVGKNNRAQATIRVRRFSQAKERHSNRRPARPPTKQVPLRTTSLVAAAVPWVSPTGPTSVPPAPLSPSSAPTSRLARPVRRAAF